MSRRLHLAIALTLTLPLVAGCARRGGNGGGGGGGGGEDQPTQSDDDDVVDDENVYSGWGRNVGDTSMAENADVGDGSRTLYVVNLTDSTVYEVVGWSCNEAETFTLGTDFGGGEYAIISGLTESCWYFQAANDDGLHEYSVEEIDSDWTWALGEGGGGEGDDDDEGAM